jgi:DNA-nicking Smr family endonuclease
MKNIIHEIDLHGVNMADSKIILDEFFERLKTNKHRTTDLHVVVGVGTRSTHGPVLPSFVMNYLKEKEIKGELKNGVIKVIV